MKSSPISQNGESRPWEDEALILSSDVLSVREVEVRQRRTLHFKIGSLPLLWTFLEADGPRQKRAEISLSVTGVMTPRIRAGRLYDRLLAHLSRNQLFTGDDALGVGVNFVEAIEKKVIECDVLIAVIEMRQLTSKDVQGGRRLDNPKDFVRMEIATALRRDIGAFAAERGQM